MPTYEYRCPEGHDFELIQKMSDKPRAKCPVCGRPATRRISGGAGLVFKGTGFYITDYGKDGKGPRKDRDEASSPTTTGSNAASDSAASSAPTSDKPAADKPAAEKPAASKPAKPAGKKAEE